MCVIVYKPAGQPIPDTKTLRACWDANPDGAGFMHPERGSVRIAKGFMEWRRFADALEAEAGRFDMLATPLAMHFRIATHGAVTPGCCHPFPVCGSASQMRATEQLADVGFMHNGVLSGLATSDDVSDSMAFDKGVLSPLSALAGDLLESGEAQRVIDAAAQGSRFLLMDGSGRVLTFGRWVSIGGVLYSNDRFRAMRWLHRSCESAEPGEQTSMLDALYAFGGPSERGLFPACQACDAFLECAQGTPYCADERDAEQLAGCC